MASKYLDLYKVPSKFPEILKDFSFHLLRDVPQDIEEYAAQYFESLRDGNTEFFEQKEKEYEQKMKIEGIEVKLHSNQTQGTENQPQEEEEELPDLKDKDVQKATAMIQGAYWKKKNTGGAKPKPNPGKDIPNQGTLSTGVDTKSSTIDSNFKNQDNNPIQSSPPQQNINEQKKEEEEEEELPDLKDRDVQKATAMIQGAYWKKKKTGPSAATKPNEETQTKPIEPKQEQPKVEDKPKQEEPKKQEEEEEELPDLKDKDVQKATAMIQGAYWKKKKPAPTTSSKTKIEDEPTKKEEPKAEEKPKPEEPKKQEEEEEELPDLKDKDVQKATAMIQGAYWKKKKPAPTTSSKTKLEEQPKPEEPKQEEVKAEPEPTKNEEDEELPDLNAADVQKATAKIQGAYWKRKKTTGFNKAALDSVSLAGTQVNITKINLAPWYQLEDDDEKKRINLLKSKCNSVGINYFDLFGEKSVEFVAEGINNRQFKREEITVSYKLQTTPTITYDDLIQELQPQLDSLGDETIDIVFALRPQEDVNIPNLCTAFSQLVQNKKTKLWGLYGWLNEEIEAIHKHCKENNLNNLGVIQNEFSLQSIEFLEQTVALSKNLGIDCLGCLDYNEEYARFEQNQKMAAIAQESNYEINQLSIHAALSIGIKSVSVVVGSVSQLEKATKVLEGYVEFDSEKLSAIKVALESTIDAQEEEEEEEEE